MINNIKKSGAPDRSVIIIKDVVSGEEWYAKKKIFVNHCQQLKEFDRYINGNKGLTVLLLK